MFAWFRKLARRIGRPWQITLGVAVAILVAGGLWLRSRPSARPGFELRTAVPAASAGFPLALYQSLGVRLEAGHTVERLNNGAVFDSLERDLREAKSSLHLLFYIWE